ncbi:MAG: 2Fe-2S iron-sulfur cluster-binding protein, partial [Dehalococcoidia bacterium]
MDSVNVTVNGVQFTGDKGMTILDLCTQNGIDIPTLCYLPGLSPLGACRLCVVEVEGSRTLQAACHTPISKGMVVLTHSPKVMAARRIIIELLL